MRKLCILLMVILVVVSTFGCVNARYKEENIIGLTSSEIVKKYGDFDRKQGTPDTEGVYRNCACGYLTKEANKGVLGTTPPEYFMIYFDSDGIARFCNYEEVV